MVERRIPTELEKSLKHGDYWHTNDYRHRANPLRCASFSLSYCSCGYETIHITQTRLRLVLRPSQTGPLYTSCAASQCLSLASQWRRDSFLYRLCILLDMVLLVSMRWINMHTVAWSLSYVDETIHPETKGLETNTYWCFLSTCVEVRKGWVDLLHTWLDLVRPGANQTLDYFSGHHLWSGRHSQLTTPIGSRPEYFNAISE